MDNDTFGLLESAASEFGLKPAQLAAETLALALPIYLEIKRQHKTNERELMTRALEIALGKSPAEKPAHPSMARPARRRGGG